ncbi:MAG: ATP-binding cassette domain-containing protein [Nitrospira sp.]|nr:ATP-binding cassette domain-containing protein [Nitrospira sp.]MCP9442266.1 ATP-binding cassette domain-containing protein [Nitrospira sp.]
MKELYGSNYPNLFQALMRQLSVGSRVEKKLLTVILAYALAIGLFSLIVPLTVQELVSTFSYAVQPVMIWTLTGIMLAVLLFVGMFKTFHFYAVEIVQRRIFARVAIAMAQQLPRYRFQGYKPDLANRFIEIVFMQRALSTLLIDLVNVMVGGAVGMILLVVYHPYFLVYDMLLMVGFAITFFVLSRGALRTTMDMSEAKYRVFEWMQDISRNVLQLKATDSSPWVMQKTDQLINQYTETRKARIRVLLRQYIGSVSGQAVAQAGALALAGWLMAQGQMTLGQLVAAEVVVGALVLNFDSLIKNMGHVYYFFTAVMELSDFFSLQRDPLPTASTVALPAHLNEGIRVTCKSVGLVHDGTPVFDGFNLDVAPGEKLGIYARTTTAKTALARVLGGLEAPTSGVVQYNGVDLRYIDPTVLSQCRSVMIDSQLSLLKGTIEDNIVLGRSYVTYDDIIWALRFTELEEDIDVLPQGIKSDISELGEALSPGHAVQILLARAILGRPQVLIFDGLIHSLEPSLRERILRRLCAKEEPWSVIFVSTDPNLTDHADRRVMLHHAHM